MSVSFPAAGVMLGLLAVSTTWGLAGCSGRGESMAVPEAGSQDRQVSLYLYPPASTGIPAQVIPLANIESNTDGVVYLDSGTTVTGRLEVLLVDGEETRTERVVGEVRATIAGTNLGFDAQVNPTDGTFELTVPQDRYEITVIPNDEVYAIPPQHFSDVSISARNQGVLELPPLDPGVPIQVVLTWADGSPLTGAQVYALDATDGSLSSVAIPSETESEGIYWIQMARGHQTLWVGPTESGEMPLYNTQIAELELDEFTTEWPPIEFAYPAMSYEVSGKTVNSVGQPVPDVAVFATRQAKEQEGSYQAQAQTDANGEFALWLPEGTYEFVFRPSTVAELSGARLDGVYVNETSERWLGSVVLADRVELELTIRGPEGSPVGGAAVTVQSDPNDRSNPGTSAFTDDEGVCVLTLGIGSYLVAVDPPSDSDLARKVTPITVGPETSSLEDIRLEQGFSSTLTFLSGRTPVSGLVLQAWEAMADGTYVDSPVYLLATAVSDERGQARLVLPPP